MTRSFLLFLLFPLEGLQLVLVVGDVDVIMDMDGLSFVIECPSGGVCGREDWYWGDGLSKNVEMMPGCHSCWFKGCCGRCYYTKSQRENKWPKRIDIPGVIGSGALGLQNENRLRWFERDDVEACCSSFNSTSSMSWPWWLGPARARSMSNVASLLLFLFQ